MHDALQLRLYFDTVILKCIENLQNHRKGDNGYISKYLGMVLIYLDPLLLRQQQVKRIAHPVVCHLW